jgi:thiamine pyrophosphokinase
MHAASGISYHRHQYMPPKDLISCYALICNGEFEFPSTLTSKIQQFGCLIGVDGGINYCDKLGLTPHWIIGDFDSVDPDILKKFQDSEALTLPRAKDETDLEAAINRAIKIDSHAQMVIFGGLGGRIDHTLGNLYLLLRHPGQLFIESENQVIFGASEVNGNIKIDKTNFSMLAIHAFYEDIVIELGKRNICLTKGETTIIPEAIGSCFKITRGEAIFILDRREISQAIIPADVVDFSANQSLINIFQILFNQVSKSDPFITKDNELIFCLHPSKKPYIFSFGLGRVISLIPLYGAVSDIKTSGLYWEIGESLHSLDKNFVGISNVCKAEEFSIIFDKGTLLCIINSFEDMSLFSRS